MTESQELKKTPLYELFKEKGVKLVDYGGWAMPIQFSGILKEHESVRKSLGLFDCSHMGEVEVAGEEAENYLDRLLTNAVQKLQPGGAQYNLICLPTGGVVDDVILYRLEDHRFLVVCNASNTEKVWSWMQEHAKGWDVQLTDRSQQLGLIAIQGPLAEQVLQELTEESLAELERNQLLQNIQIAGVDISILSRTGYTGEDGFEVYLPAEATPQLWEVLVEKAEAVGGLECGLGSRDTLRLEAGLPLYGQELSEEITPLMTGLGFAVKTKKAADFIGKEALAKEREAGSAKKIVAFKLLERGIPRHGYVVYNEAGEQVGEVTSGTQSPTLKEAIGMALVDTPYAEVGAKIYVEVRNKKLAAEVVKKPFYKK